MNLLLRCELHVPHAPNYSHELAPVAAVMAGLLSYKLKLRIYRQFNLQNNINTFLQDKYFHKSFLNV